MIAVRRAFGAVVLGVLLGGSLAGCVVGQADQNAFKTATEKAMLNTYGFPLNADQTRCFAGRLVDEIGTKNLRARGITPNDISGNKALAKITLTDAQVQALVPALFDGGCVDFGTLADELLQTAGSKRLDATQLGCVANGLSSDTAFRMGFTRLLTQTSATSDAASATLSSVFSRCGVQLQLQNG
jgi:hypothetical protein